MQCILGSGGAIGRELEIYLASKNIPVRLVSRNPKAEREGSELMPLDLSVSGAIDQAVAGTEVVYVTIGFPYFLKVWQAQWPPFITAVIAACEKHGARLVFFDNIYMYDPAHLGHMTEETPFGPVSKKGEVRALLVRLIEEAVEQGRIDALIARSADFYGPQIANSSMMNELVLKNLNKGKKANWMGPLHYRHSFTFTPDAAVATGMLGNTPSAYNQTWHLPTAESPPTAREWIDMAAEMMQAKARIQLLTPFIASVMGIFIPVMKEVKEMMYQYQSDYVFVSDKFNKAFNFTPTSPKEGLRQVIDSDF